ncbi:hypothetical protein ACHAXR_010904 [Thalassiosira sp. AJA248-18]
MQMKRTVNPVGWNGSTMNKHITSHEDNADEVMDLLKLLKLLKIENATTMGISTGGGIAFYLAQKYPDVITAAFLMHSIPLSGLKYLTINNELVLLKSIEEIQASTILPSEDPDFVYELFKSMSTKPDHYIPKDHKLNQYFTKAALNMPGSSDASVANVRFNVTPIKIPFAPPSEALSTIQNKVIDTIVPWQIVEPLTKLAIAEQWAPDGKLSFYNDELGHMSLIDHPYLLAKVYRRAYDEQDLAPMDPRALLPALDLVQFINLLDRANIMTDKMQSMMVNLGTQLREDQDETNPIISELENNQTELGQVQFALEVMYQEINEIISAHDDGSDGNNE